MVAIPETTTEPEDEVEEADFLDEPLLEDTGQESADEWTPTLGPSASGEGNAACETVDVAEDAECSSRVQGEQAEAEPGLAAELDIEPSLNLGAGSEVQTDSPVFLLDQDISWLAIPPVDSYYPDWKVADEASQAQLQAVLSSFAAKVDPEWPTVQKVGPSRFLVGSTGGQLGEA